MFRTATSLSTLLLLPFLLPLVARPSTVTGVLQAVIADDFDNRRCETLYYLQETGTQSLIEVTFAHQVHGIEKLIGATIRVPRGDRSNSIAIKNAAQMDILSPPPQENSGGTAGAITTYNAAIIAISFSNMQIECTNEEIEETFLCDPEGRSVRDFYEDSSNDQVTWTADVFSAALDMEPDSCSDLTPFTVWGALAVQQLEEAGLDFSAYTHVVYVFPFDIPCPPSGQAYVQGRESWNRLCHSGSVYAHEIGHNFGVAHAASLIGGEIVEYGGPADVMGAAFFEFNAIHRCDLGYLSDSNHQDTTTAGTYTLYPLEGHSDQLTTLQALRLVRDSPAHDYVLSYRLAEGAFDEGLPLAFADRLHIHKDWYIGGPNTQIDTVFLDAIREGDGFSNEEDSVFIHNVVDAGASVTFDLSLNVEDFDHHAFDEVSLLGTVDGDYTDTFMADGESQLLHEQPLANVTGLEHKWLLELPSEYQVTFYVRGHRTTAGDDDNYVFSYSTDDLEYQEMLTISASSPAKEHQTYELPNRLSGLIFIRVQDSERSPGEVSTGSLAVDHLFTRSLPGHDACLDQNNDYAIGDFELLYVLNHWQYETGSGDMNADGAVDVQDILFVLNNWGPCP